MRGPFVSAQADGPIEGVVFDLDGTLYHLPMARVRLSVRLWRSIGLLKQYEPARRSLRGRSFPDAARLGEAFARELGRLASVAPEQAARWFDEVFFEAFIDLLRSSARPRPGLLPLLSRLRSRGVKLAVLTDVGRVEDRLRALGIPAAAFDVLMCSEACGELKPSPRALLLVAERMGLDPSRVLVVGDRADLDGRAAQAAATDCLIIDDRPRLLRRAGDDARRLAWPAVIETIVARTRISPG
jgi:HAD superfamily hydrolase (TIGR01509 family)